MDVYLGLGSNLGDRRNNLDRAIECLGREGIAVERVSPVVESPAMLPSGATPDWNRPYLNAVVCCTTQLSPDAALRCIKRIEAELGRNLEAPRWSPRPMDIDILLWGDEQILTPSLAIPHPGLASRTFVLAPLAAIAPGLRVPGHEGATALSLSHRLAHRLPLWMGILNITPDSFSDGGELLDSSTLEPRIDAMLEAGAQIIDIGAESTRPGAARITPAEEWSRLEPALAQLLEKAEASVLPPLISVDTYHADVARRALELGADIINDVSGLTAPDMLELAAAHTHDWIAMHSVTVPVERTATLPTDKDPAQCLREWTDARLEQWDRAGIAHERIVFDPGIGFGKTPLQDLALLRDVRAWAPPGLRVLVGHSRKSFTKGFAGPDQRDKDRVTIGASMKLCAQGVDILRVHNVPAHTMAYRGWAHLED